MRRDPRDLYATMRDDYGPVVPVVLDGGVFAWLVLGFNELQEVLRPRPQWQSDFSRDSRFWRPREGPIPKEWPLQVHTKWRRNAVFASGPEHRRLRGALIRALGKVSTAAVRRLTMTTGDRLINEFIAHGQADLIRQYAAPLPLLTLMRLFGFPTEAEQQLLTAIPALLECGDESREADQQVMRIVAEHVARRRKEPAADITTWLIQDKEAALDDTELCEQIWLTINAGQGATSVWIANVFEQLVSRRTVRHDMYAGWMDIEGALAATLWERTPLANVIGRWATRDTHLGGRRIQDGDMLVLSLEGANTDPRLGSAAARTSFVSHNAGNLSWGGGAHECPGSAPTVARAIAQAAVECIWDRIPDVHLTDPDQPLDWGPSIMMRALRSLPVTFDPAKPRATSRRSTLPGGR